MNKIAKGKQKLDDSKLYRFYSGFLGFIQIIPWYGHLAIAVFICILLETTNIYQDSWNRENPLCSLVPLIEPYHTVLQGTTVLFFCILSICIPKAENERIDSSALR